MRQASRVRIGIVIVAGVCAALVGCASRPVEEEARPRHPFPKWVSYLETGKTDINEVLAVFGEPREMEERHGSGPAWRYVMAEIHWTADDPMRPEVASDGTPVPYVPTFGERAAKQFDRALTFVDRLVFYPPAREREPRSRHLPATIHDLELFFGSDGTLRRYRYTPGPGFETVYRPR